MFEEGRQVSLGAVLGDYVAIASAHEHLLAVHYVGVAALSQHPHLPEKQVLLLALPGCLQTHHLDRHPLT